MREMAMGGIEECDVLVTGTGSLAQEAIMALSLVDAGPLRIGIGGRSHDKCRWLALAANARATSLGLPNSFAPVPIDWSSADSMAAAIASSKPRVIFHTATLQSSWELTKPSAWGDLIATGGFVLTAPLHTVLPGRLVAAQRDAGHQAVTVNGTLPDFVNGLLTAAGCAVATGFGNISILTTAITAFLARRQAGAVRMVAQWEPHVADFRLPPEQRRPSDTMLWIDGKREENFHHRFRDLRFPPATDTALNLLTGTLVAPMALGLLGRRDYIGHAPGPDGRPGGYPIAIRGGRLSLDLPEGVSEAEAIAFNTRFEEEDHVQFDRGRKFVALHGPARAALKPHLPEFAEGYSVASLADIEAVANALLSLRDRLGGS